MALLRAINLQRVLPRPASAFSRAPAPPLLQWLRGRERVSLMKMQDSLVAGVVAVIGILVICSWTARALAGRVDVRLGGSNVECLA